MRLPLLKLLEYVGEHSGDDASFGPFLSPTHGVGFAATSLAVGENSTVVAVETVVDDRLGNGFEHLLLVCLFLESLLKTELMMITRIGHLVARDIQVYYLL